MILTLSTEDMWFSPNFLLLDLFSPHVADLDVLALSMPDVADLVPDLERGDVADLNVPDLGSPHVVDCKSERHGYLKCIDKYH